MKRKSLLFLAMTLALATVMNLFAGIAVFADDAEPVSDTIEAVAFTQGSGTADDPYQITEAGHLVKINDELTACYKLMNDIDLGGVVWTPIGGGTTNDDTPFSGVFDGNGKKISNFKLEDNETYHYQLGFFAKATGGTIKNVTFANAFMTLDQGTSRDNGFIVGYAGAGSTISGCLVDSTVTITVSNMTAPNYFRLGGLVGGLVGEGSVMEYCKNSANITVTALTDTLGNVNTRFDIGGMAAILGGRIFRCINEGNISVDRSSYTSYKYRFIGGIVGSIGEYAPTSGNIIEDCINYGCVKYTNAHRTTADNFAGGILGANFYYGKDTTLNANVVYHSVSLNGNFNFGELSAASVEKETHFAGRIFQTSSVERPNYGDSAVSEYKIGPGSSTDWYEEGDFVLADKATLQAMPEYKAIVAEVEEHLTGVSTDYVGYQTTAVNSDNRFDMRLVATLTGDYTKCQNVGFKVTVNTLDEQIATTTALYDSITATVAGAESEEVYTAEELDGDYIFVLVCKGLPANTTLNFTVTTFYTTADGKIVSETETFEASVPNDTVVAQ